VQIHDVPRVSRLLDELRNLRPAARPSASFEDKRYLNSHREDSLDRRAARPRRARRGRRDLNAGSMACATC